ncbi:hypothetical protein J6590_092239 [Homalodisca vitripennis]|nr:hypothetical protein J6590_092239 [Homalodisca vitripennis]
MLAPDLQMEVSNDLDIQYDDQWVIIGIQYSDVKTWEIIRCSSRSARSPKRTAQINDGIRAVLECRANFAESPSIIASNSTSGQRLHADYDLLDLIK